MTLTTSFRQLFRPTAAFCLLAGCLVTSSLHGQKVLPVPEHRTPATPPSVAAQRRVPLQRLPGGGKLQGEHLAGWLDHHRTENTPQKLQALEKEPGFKDLPAVTQQRMRDRLVQLDAMPPEKRERIIARTEAMEKLTPAQRGQVRSTMVQLASLPPASRNAVGRTFRVVRDMSPAQRQEYLNSPDIKSQFTDQEKDTLQRLMAVEPFLPPGTAVTQQP